MIKRYLFFLSMIICSLPLYAYDDVNHDGTYSLKMSLDGSAYSYTYNNCFIKIYDGIADIEFDYKMTKSSTASTNYVLTTGSGSGWINGKIFNGTGSGVISTYEKGKLDNEFGFQFTMDGTFSGELELRGTFIFTENGEPVKGTYISMRIVNDPSDTLGARFSAMEGQVEIMTPGETDYKVAKLDMRIPMHSYIKTDEDATATLSFNGGNGIWVMRPNTCVITVTHQKSSKLSMVMGNIWVNVKKMIKDGSMEIDMNQAVAGIKGTTFVCEDDGTTSTLKVIEGTVWFKSKTNEKEHIKVEAGEMISATKSGLGTKTTFDVDAETAAWDKYRNTSIIDKILRSTLYIIIISASLLLLIALILFFIIRKRKRKKRLLKSGSGQTVEPKHTVNQQQKTETIIPPVVQSTADPAPPVKPQQFCTSCGAKLKPEAKFCHSCAKPVVKK